MTALREAEKVVRDRERAARREAVAAEAERIAADERRRAAREEHSARIAAMREAEDRLRAHEDATKVTLTCFGVRVTARPEASADAVQRRQTAHALAEALALMAQAFDEQVGAVRAEASGHPAPEPRFTTSYLLTRLRDAMRHALAAGTVTVESA
jgi:hypothetical protein